MGLTPGSATEVADYVAAALRLATVPLGALLPLLERDGFVLFCSSSAVSAPPRDWPHYVAAKSALEGLAAWTAAANPGVRSVAARLPKMLTAMTNSPSMRLGAAAPEPVALRLAALLEPGAVQPGYTLLEEEFA
jgi:NAD(P)-dependent dehydrogenase (short-subunit alcohol dehydrogenase family)